jgi:iron(III) transport system permease protein
MSCSVTRFYSALVNTVFISVISTFGGLVIAVLFAWLIERTDMPFRSLAWIAVLLPLAIPGVLFALSWMLLLAPRMGLINIALRGFISLFDFSSKKDPLTSNPCGASSSSVG